tara:strand:+ start:333 stop:590 length:258 start_codon:yes stop_codon:yes gene_type:complete
MWSSFDVADTRRSIAWRRVRPVNVFSANDNGGHISQAELMAASGAYKSDVEFSIENNRVADWVIWCCRNVRLLAPQRQSPTGIPA